MIFVFLFFCFLVLSLFLGEELSSYSRLSKKNIGFSCALAGATSQEEKEEDAFFFTQLVIFFKTCAGT